MARHGDAGTLAQAAARDWIALDASMAQHRYAQWLGQALPGARIAVTSHSILGLVHATRADMGLAALPTALGDAEPNLVRQFGPVPELSRIWRMLTTRHLRRTPRVASFSDFMARESALLKPILGG